MKLYGSNFPILSRADFSLILALISGSLGTLAFSPYDFWPAGILSLFGLQLLLLEKKTHYQAASTAFVWGIGFFGSGINWIYVGISHFGGMLWPLNVFIVLLLIIYLSLYPMLFAILLNKIRCNSTSLINLVLIAPSIWQITEFLRGHIFTGFPWLQFGYSQIDGPLKGIAPLAGVEAITFLLMSIAGLLAHFFYYFSLKSLISAILALTLPWPLNMLQWYNVSSKHNVTIAMVQGNISQSIKWNQQQLLDTLQVYISCSKPWIGKASMIIWPESAISDLEVNQQPFLHVLDEDMRNQGSSLITGIINSELKDDNLFYSYNSIIVLGEKQPYFYQNDNRYQKNHLVPFGEFVPMQNLLRPLAPLFNLPMSSFSRGSYIQPQLKVLGYNLTSAICYEIILGEQIRANFRPSTDLILSISNDAWFGHSNASWQHFQMARMRALELGRTLLHSTNNGITGVVNANGNIKKILPPFTRQVLTDKITLTTGETPYSRVGAWPIWILTCISLIISIIILLR